MTDNPNNQPPEGAEVYQPDPDYKPVRDDKGRFIPGSSGNPGGMPRPAGAYVAHYLNIFCRQMEEGKLSVTQLRAIRADESQPWQKIQAAKLMLNSITDDSMAEGKLDPGKDFDRICDRTEGKPHQSSTVDVKVTDSAEQARARLMAKLGQKPDDEEQAHE